MSIIIKGSGLTIDDLVNVARYNQKIELDKDALERIKKGTYGVCQKCKGKVRRKRLKAFPEANLCIKCAK